MTKIILFSQNLVFSSLLSFLEKELSPSDECVFVTPHKLFDFEKERIMKLINKPLFYTFSELITDTEEATIDVESYNNHPKAVNDYYDEIKKQKNKMIVKKLNDLFGHYEGFALSDDLGIDIKSWVDAGFSKINGEYFFVPSFDNRVSKRNIFKSISRYLSNPIYVSKSKKTKIVFYGSLNRVGYRMNITFKKSIIENYKYLLFKVCFRLFRHSPCNVKKIRLSSIHESSRWSFPRYNRFQVGIIQDGFLPENYSSLYLKFVGENITYLTWDKLGSLTFENQKIKHRIMPFRNKIYLKHPCFSKRVSKILFSASGAGDWTALKNRSDDDNLVIIAGELAKAYPDIQIVFRCHPSWIHPSHQGINSVNRVIEYINSLNISNFVLSGNIPENSLQDYKFSFSRNSFEKDLEGVDLVVGEHSISMIDALIKGVPFISVNVTGRRDFFSSITKLGFPHAENIKELADYINKYGTKMCVDSFDKAVDNYNAMTDEE